MPITTTQLRAALQPATPQIDHQKNAQSSGGTKLENLNLEHVYIGSKGQVHVSKSGWSAMWAGMMGRATGDAALKEGMEKLGIKPAVIKSAMEGIHAFKELRAGWEKQFRKFGIPEADWQKLPSRNLEAVIHNANEGKVDRSGLKKLADMEFRVRNEGL